MQLELDSNVRRVSNGTALLGGSPFRVVRLSAAGSDLLDGWLSGDTSPLSADAAALRDRLLRAGIVHPVQLDAAPDGAASFVVPVYNDASGLESLLGALRNERPDDQIIVVDDASPDADAIAAVAERYDAELVRHEINRGPGAARNSGWRKILSPGERIFRGHFVVFVDADVTPQPDAVRKLLAHFSDPAVAIVAPRIQAETQTSDDLISVYEGDNSPLDMGGDAAIVFPGTRLSYVPSAMLAMRADVLESARGFDEAMRYGEDVDLVWRVVSDGQLVRYEPRATATHRNRRTIMSFARQRFTYGSSAAALAARHGNKVAPLQLPVAPVASTLAMLFGGNVMRFAGGAAAVAGSISLVQRLKPHVDEANVEAARLTAMTHGYALQGMAAASTRTWAPLLLLTSRTRRALGLALVVPALADWVRDRPALDPVRHSVLRAIDHGSYCAGVWSGVLQSKSIAALLPHIRLRHEAR